MLGRSCSHLVWEHPTINKLSVALSGGAAEEAPAPGPVRTAAANDEPIAVVGIGCRFPGGDRDLTGPADYWRFLTGRGDAVREVPDGRWDPFDDGSPKSATCSTRRPGSAASSATSPGSTRGSSASRRARPPSWTRSSGSSSKWRGGVRARRHRPGVAARQPHRRVRRRVGAGVRGVHRVRPGVPGAVHGDRRRAQHHREPAVVPARPARPQHDRRHGVLVVAGLDAPRRPGAAQRRGRRGARLRREPAAVADRHDDVRPRGRDGGGRALQGVRRVRRRHGPRGGLRRRRPEAPLGRTAGRRPDPRRRQGLRRQLPTDAPTASSPRTPTRSAPAPERLRDRQASTRDRSTTSRPTGRGRSWATRSRPRRSARSSVRDAKTMRPYCWAPRSRISVTWSLRRA